MSTIEEIASVHLGKAGDGTVVAPYMTPDTIDPGLLVAIPRHLNREDYGIEEGSEPFVGFDAWNCYEFSTLWGNGMPYVGVLKISYPSDSPNIVESKSLKLYLNSFNMVRMEDPKNEVVARVRDDLTEAIGSEVNVSFATQFVTSGEVTKEYQTIEDHYSFKSLENFVSDGEDPELLRVIDQHVVRTQKLHTALLRSNCRVTNQPDWGDLYIKVTGPASLDAESVLRYVVSMRNENHFHEEIVECVFKRLYDKLPAGTEIVVVALYTRRGGIDINPVRATSYVALEAFRLIRSASVKTERQ